MKEFEHDPLFWLCIYLREMECYGKNGGAIEWLVWPWYEGWIGGGEMAGKNRSLKLYKWLLNYNI